MADPFVPDLIRARVDWDDSQYGPFSNTFSMRDAGTSALDVLATATAANIDAMWLTASGTADPLRNWFSNKVTPVLVTLTRYEAADGEQASAPIATSTGNDVNRMPADSSVCVSLRTAQSGARRRGRLFLGGMGMGVLDGSTGRVASSTAEEIRVQFVNFALNQTNDGGQLVVYSRAGAFITNVTAFIVDTEWDTQRRRGD